MFPVADNLSSMKLLHDVKTLSRNKMLYCIKDQPISPSCLVVIFSLLKKMSGTDCEGLDNTKEFICWLSIC